MGSWVLVALALVEPTRAHGSFHAQLASVNERLEANPDDADLWLARAELWRRHRDMERALSDLEQVARLAPERRDVDFFRGRTLLEAGRVEAAERSLSRFLADAPEHPAARAARARARGLLGRHRSAAADWAQAIAHQPVPLPEYYLEHARALAAASPHDPALALRALDAGLATLGPVTGLALYAVELEQARGQTDAALSRLEQIAARSGRQEVWLARRAGILADAGRSAEARLAYTRSLREIQALPAQRRTAAVRALELEVREALARLGAAPVATSSPTDWPTADPPR